MAALGPIGFVFLLIAFYLISVITILKEYERAVIFRLGRLLPETKGPGIIMVWWPIDKMERVSLRPPKTSPFCDTVTSA